MGGARRDARGGAMRCFVVAVFLVACTPFDAGPGRFYGSWCHTMCNGRVDRFEHQNGRCECAKDCATAQHEEEP